MSSSSDEEAYEEREGISLTSQKDATYHDQTQCKEDPPKCKQQEMPAAQSVYTMCKISHNVTIKDIVHVPDFIVFH